MGRHVQSGGWLSKETERVRNSIGITFYYHLKLVYDG
jgi:hypothetical protein